MCVYSGGARISGYGGPLSKFLNRYKLNMWVHKYINYKMQLEKKKDIHSS